MPACLTSGVSTRKTPHSQSKWGFSRFCFAVAALILLPSVFPSGAQFAADLLEEKAPRLYNLLPEGTRDAKTLMDRNIQFVAGAALLLQSPVLGGGMGAELMLSSALGDRDEKFVDNGWA